MNRREFIATAALPILAVGGEKETKRIDWDYVHGMGGTMLHETLNRSVDRAVREQKVIICELNGVIHVVYPDGFWEAKAPKSYRLPFGPYKGWVPPEGWSSYYGH